MSGSGSSGSDPGPLGSLGSSGPSSQFSSSSGTTVPSLSSFPSLSSRSRVNANVHIPSVPPLRAKRRRSSVGKENDTSMSASMNASVNTSARGGGSGNGNGSSHTSLKHARPRISTNDEKVEENTPKSSFKPDVNTSVNVNNSIGNRSINTNSCTSRNNSMLFSPLVSGRDDYRETISANNGNANINKSLNVNMNTPSSNSLNITGASPSMTMNSNTSINMSMTMSPVLRPEESKEELFCLDFIKNTNRNMNQINMSAEEEQSHVQLCHDISDNIHGAANDVKKWRRVLEVTCAYVGILGKSGPTSYDMGTDSVNMGAKLIRLHKRAVSRFVDLDQQSQEQLQNDVTAMSVDHVAFDSTNGNISITDTRDLFVIWLLYGVVQYEYGNGDVLKAESTFRHMQRKGLGKKEADLYICLAEIELAKDTHVGANDNKKGLVIGKSRMKRLLPNDFMKTCNSIISPSWPSTDEDLQVTCAACCWGKPALNAAIKNIQNGIICGAQPKERLEQCLEQLVVLRGYENEEKQGEMNGNHKDYDLDSEASVGHSGSFSSSNVNDKREGHPSGSGSGSINPAQVQAERLASLRKRTGLLATNTMGARAPVMRSLPKLGKLREPFTKRHEQNPSASVSFSASASASASTTPSSSTTTSIGDAISANDTSVSTNISGLSSTSILRQRLQNRRLGELRVGAQRQRVGGRLASLRVASSTAAFDDNKKEHKPDNVGEDDSDEIQPFIQDEMQKRPSMAIDKKQIGYLLNWDPADHRSTFMAKKKVEEEQMTVAMNMNIDGDKRFKSQPPPMDKIDEVTAGGESMQSGRTNSDGHSSGSGTGTATGSLQSGHSNSSAHNSHDSSSRADRGYAKADRLGESNNVPKEDKSPNEYPATVTTNHTPDSSVVTHVQSPSVPLGFQKIFNMKNFITIKSNPYLKLSVIGKGGSCKVYRALSKDRSIVAIKKVKIKGGMSRKAVEGYANEIKLLRQLRGNPAIIQLYESEIDMKQKAIYLVMEPGDIDLNHVLQQQRSQENNKGRSSVNMNFVRLTWQQMLSAVHCIHEQRIIHGDLKPANFLFVKGVLKLIDFGIAKSIQSDDTTNIYRESQVGTLNYMSPESFVDSGTGENGARMKCGRPSDVWSLGCILYQMCYAKTPFADLPFMAKIKAIVNEGHQVKFPETIDAAAIDAMQQCLRFKPEERAPIVGVNGLLNAHWFLHSNMAQPS